MESPQSPTRGKEVQMQMQMQMHYGVGSCFHMMPHQNNLNLDTVEKMMESPHRPNNYNHNHDHNSTEFSEYQSFPIHRRKEESAPAYPTATSNSNANAGINFSTPRRVYGRKRKIGETSSSVVPTSAVSIQSNVNLFETPDRHGNEKTPQNATCHGASYSTVPPMHHNIAKPVLDTTPVSNFDKSTSLLFSDSGPRLNFLEGRQQLLNAEQRVSEFSNGALKSQGSSYLGFSSGSGSGSQSNGQIHDVPHNVLKNTSLHAEANDLNSSDESLDDIFFLALPGSDAGSLLGSAGASSGQASRNSSRATNSIANANTHAYAKNDMYVPNVTRLLPSRAQNSRSCESFGPSACQSHYSSSNFSNSNSNSNSNSHSDTSSSRDSDEYFQRDSSTANGVIYSAIALNKPRGCGVVAPGPRPTSRHYFMPILPRCMSSESSGDHTDYGELDAWNRLSPSRGIIETCAEPKPIAHSNFNSGNCKAQSGNIGSKDVDINPAQKTDCSKPLRGCSSTFRAPIPKSIHSRINGLQEDTPLHPTSMDAAIAGESLTSASKSRERARAPNTASVSVSASAPLSKSQNTQTTSTLTLTPPTQLHAPKPIRLHGYSYSEHSHNCIIGNGTGPTPRSVYSTSWSQPNTGTGNTVTGIDFLCAKEQEEEKFVNESPELLFPTLQAPCPTLGPAGSSQFNYLNTLDISGHRRYSSMLDSINCYSPIFQD